MLSGVLNSERAIEVNIAIMRIFTKLRSFSLLEKQLIDKVDKLGSDVTEVFKIVFERLEDSMSEDRTKIGIKKDN
jgi:hypothetical protein